MVRIIVSFKWNYKFDFRKGFRYKWNALLSVALFNGDFCASAYKRSYTFPSYAPSAEHNIPSGISKPSTIPTAFGRIWDKQFSNL